MKKTTTAGKEKKEPEKQFFLKQIHETMPANQAHDASKPDSTWEIDFVHGFGGDRNKSSLFFGKDNNEIVFSTAALGVVQDLTNRKQKFFGGIEKEKDAEKYQPNWANH